jgi:L,D-transpeptidase YcbB
MRRGCIPLALGLASALAAPVAWAAASPARAAAAPAQANDVIIQISKKAKGKLKKFYLSRGFRPLWAPAGTIGPAADALLALLTTADLDGLKPASYKVDDLRKAIDEASTGDAKAAARAEIKLSNAFSRYAADMRRPSDGGMTYVDPQLKPKKLSQDAVLTAASFPPSFRDYVAAMGWMSPHYVRLRTLLAQAKAQGSAEDVLRRIRLNMARAHPLPGPWTHHVVVDAASGRLWYYQAGGQLGTMRVVVGKPGSQTPMLAGMLQYAILNPYWNVPVDLAQKLIAPKVLAGRSLKSMGFEALADWSAAPARLDPTKIDWKAVASGAQELRIRQLPGGGNSMGRVKFMFPNEMGIYLHDTPERALFLKDDRHLSNGCIRLEDAAGLGKWLLGRPIRAATKLPEQIVPLAVPVPVYLTYFSAIETKDGAGFLDDVYRLDQ